MADTARILEDFARSEPSARSFAARAFDAAWEPSSIAFRAMFAGVARRLGEAGGAAPKEAPSIPDARPHWTLTDWIRAALVLRALRSVEVAAQPAVVQRLFEGGELGEQESLLRILEVLPLPSRYVETALLGCRTNARRVFEAIACDNAYPERHFSERSFNQMVLKAIFIEVPVARIEGLARRRGAELERMARDYASERRAAGRPVPADVDVVLAGSQS
jgi:hypothetical protein